MDLSGCLAVPFVSVERSQERADTINRRGRRKSFWLAFSELFRFQSLDGYALRYPAGESGAAEGDQVERPASE